MGLCSETKSQKTSVITRRCGNKPQIICPSILGRRRTHNLQISTFGRNLWPSTGWLQWRRTEERSAELWVTGWVGKNQMHGLSTIQMEAKLCHHLELVTPLAFASTTTGTLACWVLSGWRWMKDKVPAGGKAPSGYFGSPPICSTTASAWSTVKSWEHVHLQWEHLPSGRGTCWKRTR